MKEIITIKVSRFLTDELVRKIAVMQWNSSAPQCVNRSRQYIFDEIIGENDCFGVTAVSSDNNVVGRLHCIRNEDDPTLWYYGDLFVAPEYRRMGIASRMVRAAMDHLSDMGAAVLRCYVDPENMPSRSLQLSLGFTERPFKSFNSLTNDGEIMYEALIPNDLTVITASADEAYFVRMMFVQNKASLGAENISLSEWRSMLSASDDNEKHFLVCKGAMPAAYMKITAPTAADEADEARLSMLFCAKSLQRQGIGSFAVKYAEEYLRDRGCSMLSAHISSDNIAARGFFIKAGYRAVGQGDTVNFVKALR